MRNRMLLFLSLFVSVPMFAAVTGTVMTPEGQAIANARVSLYAVESVEARRVRLLSENPEAVPLVSAQTDAKGAFSLASPKDALLDLRVTANGYEPWQRRIERDEEVGAIALAKAETKSGTVKANGKPVANAAVVVGYGATEYVTKTNEEGRWEAPDPKKARTIVVLHPNFAVSEETSMGIRDGITNLNRTLNAGTAIAGRAVLEDGTTPVAKATVFVDGWPMATSADDGTFTIPRAPSKWSSVIAQGGNLIGRRTTSTERPLKVRLSKAATVTGRVLDAKTKVPVAGAVVRVNSRGMRQADTWWSTASDAKGNFTLQVLPGAYNLAASHPAYEVRNIDVNAVGAQMASKELVLSPMSRVTGVVVNDERKPVAAAVVGAQDASRGDMEFAPMRIIRDSSAYSGPDGRFSLRVRSESDLKIRAVKKGFPPATSSETMKLSPGERKSNIVLTIPSGIAVTGKVTDRDGKPLSGVAVTSTLSPTGQRGMMQRIMIGGAPPADDDSVRTGSDGTFTVRVVEGTHDFTLRREGFATKHVRSKSVTVAGPNTIETTLDPSVEISGRVTRGGVGVDSVMVLSFGDGDSTDTMTGPDGSFVLTGLTPGPARLMLRKEEDMVSEQRTITAPARDVAIELPAGVTVSGRVVEKGSHKPITSFQVGISLSRSGGGMVMMAPPQLRNFTSDDGSFTLENVPTGAINFIASAPGYTNTRLNLNLEEGKPVSNLELELDTGVRLIGKITGPDGAALSDASVRVAMISSGSSVMRGTNRGTTTSSSGEYELDALEPGEETIEITHSKYLPERKTVQLKGREVRLDAQLSAGSRASGVVVTDSGAPVADAEVEAMANGGSSRRAKTDASGRFEIDSLSPTRYEFRASKAGLADGRVKDVDIAAGTPVRIVMGSGGTLYGVVRGLTEQELTTTMVEARSSEGMASGGVDATGAYRIEGVPAGTVSVRATMMGRGFANRKSSAAQSVEMAAGSSRQVDIEFKSDTVIRGRVRRNGQPVPSAGVTFISKPGGPQVSVTGAADEQGNYSVSGLEDGEYTVIVNDMQRFTSFTTSYDVRGSGTFDIDHTASSLRGRVVDASSGDPLVEARVQLRNTGQQGVRFAERTAMTDANGVFNLDLVSPGSYLLTADKDGFGNHVLDLNVTDRPLDNVELRLPRSEGITLKVVDARNGKALNATVVVFDPAGRVVHEERGFFMGDTGDSMRLSLAAGTYTATVSAWGFGTRHVSLRSPSTQTVPMALAAKIIVRSKHSDRVRTRLIDASGMPYPRWSSNPPQTFLTPSPGATTIEGIAGGTYTLQLLGSGDAILDAKQIVVTDGQTVEVEI